jgi:hypothetical protein
MMVSKDKASGIPWDMPLLPDLMDSLIDFRLSSIESEDAVPGR